jgi:LysM repeat protein
MAEVQRLQTDVDVLKMNSSTITKEQEVKIEKIVSDVVQQKDLSGLVDRQVNTLSSAFSKEINGLSEKIQNVFNRIIAVLDAQQKVVTSVANAPSKQPSGIAYEVKAGETLEGIATKYKVSRESVQRINFFIDENRLSAGQMIFIPQGK